MKCKDSLAATSALTSHGHVYTATGDYPNALASHKQVGLQRENVSPLITKKVLFISMMS